MINGYASKRMGCAGYVKIPEKFTEVAFEQA
jgi:hypothetical protein